MATDNLLQVIEAERNQPQAEAPRGPTAPDGPTDGGAPRALLLDDGRVIPIGRRLSIGAAPDNDLVLADPFASGLHCVVTRIDRRVVVIDCRSRNGTFVGGTRVVSAELVAGVVLTVGRTGLRVLAGEQPPPADGMIGDGAAMRRLRHELGRVAATRASVLLVGESGTGKELAAQALHRDSGRRGALVVVNCGAVSAQLVESELFGHERGSFTGAHGRRAGLFEEADGGTLFLDEIGELPLELQPKLLRALETGAVRPVGAARERPVDVRVVAATNRELQKEVAKGHFRLDLFHRLAQVEIRVPSLRERPDDLPTLADHFLARATAGGRPKHFGAAAYAALARHPWPGNIRELRNAVQRAVLFGGDELTPKDLLPQPGSEAPAASGAAPLAALQGRGLKELERELIAAALKHHSGNRRAAAAALGMPKSTLCDKVRRYGLGDEE